jgi:hypothetical protein
MAVKPTWNPDFKLLQVNLQEDFKWRTPVIKINALYNNHLLVKEPKW